MTRRSRGAAAAIPPARRAAKPSAARRRLGAGVTFPTAARQTPAPDEPARGRLAAGATRPVPRRAGSAGGRGYNPAPMAGRSPARFLAPLALVAFALALYVVVTGATGNDPESKGTQGAKPATRSTNAPTGRKRKKTRRTYVVKSGDTPSGIAEKTGVPLTQILQLNPDLDPQSLNPGTKIKLRR